MVRQKFLEEAHSWIGTRYHHCACVKATADQKGGVDCIMILVACGKAAGIVKPDFDPRPYDQHWYEHRSEELYLKGILDHCKRTETPQPGDIALYKFGRTVSHGAIYIDQEHILHAFAENREVCITEHRMISNRFHSYWSID